MSKLPLQVTVPLLNPNEPEARLAALHVHEGQQVAAGQPLCTFETTKSASELAAETAGYVVGLRAEVGQSLPAGAVLCYLAADPKWTPAEDSPPTGTVPEGAGGLRITRPARALAEAEGLNLERLPRGVMITAEVVRRHLAEKSPTSPGRQRRPFDMSRIIVYGGGGHGKAVIELLRAAGTYRIVGLIDDGIPKGEEILGVPVLGGFPALEGLRDQGVRQAANAVGGIGDIRVRVEVFGRLQAAGFGCPTVAHPSAVIEPSAELAAGAQVFPLAYVGSEVRVGFGGIVNTGAIVSHDCRLGEYANISPGAVLAGGVQIGERCLIGMGATINLGVKVGARARVGNGATVKEDVPAEGVVRAGTLWPS